MPMRGRCNGEDTDKVEEVCFVDVGPCRSFESKSCIQLALILRKSFSVASRPRFLRQTRLVALPDVRRCEVNTVVESVLQLGQFDPLGINGGDHFIQLFLRSDHDQQGASLALLRSSC